MNIYEIVRFQTKSSKPRRILAVNNCKICKSNKRLSHLTKEFIFYIEFSSISIFYTILPHLMLILNYSVNYDISRLVNYGTL